jgi:hypothetical protein
MGSSNIYKMTLSIPQELRARMAAAAEQVNWSAVAARAFADTLLRIEARKDTSTVDDAFARLRASEEVADREDKVRGAEAGRVWARGHAEARHLRRLQRWHDQTPPGSMSWDDDDAGDALGVAYHVLEAMRGRGEISRQDSEEFWDRALGEEYPDGTLLEGFVDGALAQWAEYLRERK